MRLPVHLHMGRILRPTDSPTSLPRSTPASLLLAELLPSEIASCRWLWKWHSSLTSQKHLFCADPGVDHRAGKRSTPMRLRKEFQEILFGAKGEFLKLVFSLGLFHFVIFMFCYPEISFNGNSVFSKCNRSVQTWLDCSQFAFLPSQQQQAG